MIYYDEEYYGVSDILESLDDILFFVENYDIILEAETETGTQGDTFKSKMADIFGSLRTNISKLGERIRNFVQKKGDKNNKADGLLSKLDSLGKMADNGLSKLMGLAPASISGAIQDSINNTVSNITDQVKKVTTDAANNLFNKGADVVNNKVNKIFKNGETQQESYNDFNIEESIYVLESYEYAIDLIDINEAGELGKGLVSACEWLKNAISGLLAKLKFIATGKAKEVPSQQIPASKQLIPSVIDLSRSVSDLIYDVRDAQYVRDNKSQSILKSKFQALSRKYKRYAEEVNYHYNSPLGNRYY